MQTLKMYCRPAAQISKIASNYPAPAPAGQGPCAYNYTSEKELAGRQ